jgi:hypothetical protein
MFLQGRRGLWNSIFLDDLLATLDDTAEKQGAHVKRTSHGFFDTYVDWDNKLTIYKEVHEVAPMP